MLLSLFYVLSFAGLFAGVLMFPKNDKNCSLAVGSVISLITVFCLHTVAGVLICNVMGLRINLLSMGIFNIVTALILWGFIKLRFKSVQEYYGDKVGFAVLGILAAATLAVGMMRFGAAFNMFRYATSDSAVHFHRVLAIVNSESLHGIGRFYLYIIEAMVVWVLSPFVSAVNYYRIFILCDLFMWFLSGAVFLALIRRFMVNKKMIRWGTAFVLLYYFAYPMNNLIYGFNYLGAAVTLAGFILYAARCFGDGLMWRWYSLGCIGIGNLAVALCYSQLMPVTFAGSILYMGAVMISGRKVNYKALAGAVVLCAAIGAFSVYYIVIKGYGSLEVLFSNLQGEGPIYRDMWSNIFFFLIFVVMYGIFCWKEKKLQEGYFFLLPLIAYALFFFWRMCNQQTAAYYFYKFHYLGWLFILYIAFIGLFMTIRRYEFVYKVYVSIAAVLLVVALSGLEYRLKEANVWWMPKTRADAYFDIYVWNKDALFNERTDVSNDMQAMYYVVSGIVEKENVLVPYLGNWEDYWLKYYYNLTCQEEYYDYFLDAMDVFAAGESGVAEMFEELVFNRFDNAGYVMVEKASQVYWDGVGFYNGMTVIYENDYGILYATGR